MVDLIVNGGTIITMANRRIIKDGIIVVDDGKIVEVGEKDSLKGKYESSREIDAENKVIMPGLIDTHGHAGHNLIKTVAMGHENWSNMVADIYLKGVPERFWYVDALLGSLERITFGTTTGVSFLGGGRGGYRVDDPKYAIDHAKGAEEVQIRDIIALGPVGRAPYDEREFKTYKYGKELSKIIDFQDMMQTTRNILSRYNDFNKLVTSRLAISVISPNLTDLSDVNANLRTLNESDVRVIKKQLSEIELFVEETNTGILAHGMSGVISSAKDLGLLGPNVSLAHCGGLTAEEIAILRESGTSVAHCPRAGSIIRKNCPVPELLKAGVTVSLATDGTAPKTTFDLFTDMKIALILQQHRLHTSKPIPPGKLLEMATIDAARSIGLENEIGSLEKGKRADIILLDFKKPHLTPNFMFPHRIVYEAYGQDVDTVIINGKIVLEKRKTLHVDEAEILEKAQKMSEKVVEMNSLQHQIEIKEEFWDLG
jgi:cytosine/adenosine deaminase-related metal-dependent hydrolase